MDTPSTVVTAPAPSPKSSGVRPSRKRLLDQVLVSTYVSPLERVHPLKDMVVLNLEDVRKIVRCWNPLNQEESSVMHMRDLYLNYFRITVSAYSEQYTIPLPAYVDKEAFQPVADDGMLILNPNFHRLVELISADF